jgi:hypothetical protein
VIAKITLKVVPDRSDDFPKSGIQDIQPLPLLLLELVSVLPLPLLALLPPPLLALLPPPVELLPQ